jgi:HAD superfamily phosphatase (TIGR01668 family)
MFHLLRPKQTVHSIYTIDLLRLWDKGYRHMIIDVDNTLTPWNDHHVSPGLDKWISSVKQIGFGICLLSNNHQKKVQDFATKLGVSAAPKGGKPLSRAFLRAMSILQGCSRDTLVIGDQIFTDILGGNRLGLYTILVEPITTEEFIGTKLARLLERRIAGRRPMQHNDNR